MILAITIFTIVANIYLGFSVFLHNRKSATSKLFILYTFFVSLWALANYLALVPGLSPEVSLLRIRLVLVTGGMLAPFLYLLAYTFPENKFIFSNKKKVLFIIFILITLFVAVTPLTFYDIYFANGYPVPRIGPGILIYGLNAFLLPVLSFLVLFRKLKVTTGRARNQTRIFMYGIAISYFFVELTNFVLVNVFQNSSFTTLGPFFTLILVGFLFYAITKYRFLDIKITILRAVTYIAVLMITLIVFVFGLNIGVRYIFPDAILTRDVYLIVLFMSVVIVLFVNPLYKTIDKIISKFFLKNRYSSEDLISEIMHILASEIDFDIIAPKLLDTITRKINISKMAILSVDQHKVTDIKEVGFGQLKDAEKFKYFEDIFHKNNLGEIILFNEIEDEDLKNVFRGTEVEVIVPIKISNKEVAIVLYGSKVNSEMYTNTDLDVMKILARQIGEKIESTYKFKMLKLVDKIRSDFVDSVSHEFRTPLTESRWRLEMMLGEDYKYKLEKGAKKDISDVYMSVRWLVESLNQLIVASNFETTNLSIDKQDIDIRELIKKDLIEKTKEISDIKNVSIDMDMEESLPLIQIDSVKIKQALSIILENAIKYSKDKSKIYIKVFVREAEDTSKFLHIEVKDSGIGIKKEELLHMFSKFYRGSDARHTVPNGLGIGLYIAKTFIELHDGKIWVESEPDKGSTFFIEIPY